MSYGECPFANESCKYFERSPVPGGNKENGCFSDLDHKVPKRLATTALARAFIYSPENLQQLCRSEHDEKCKEGDDPLPDRETMKERVLAQMKIGRISVSRSLVKEIRRGYGELAS